MNVRCLPTSPTACGWTTKLGRPRQFPQLRGPRTSPYVVLGSGFTGLAAARRLAEHFPDRQILLVDALEIGGGASSRNSGFIVSPGTLGEDENSGINQSLYRLGRAGIHALSKLVQRYRIDCDWHENGRIIGARSSVGCRSVDHKSRILDRIKAPYERLTGQDLASLTGMDGYRQAIRQLDGVLVNPAALVRGLADALPSNVTVLQKTPITGIHNGKCIRLESPAGSITTQSLLITTNAYSRSPGWFANRVFPMRTFASVAQFPDAFNPSHPSSSRIWGLTSAGRIGTSLRSLPDKRILIRNTTAIGFCAKNTQAELNRVAAIHARSLRDRFPDRPPASIQQTWGGVMGMTVNGASFFGKVKPDIWVMNGHNGHGIAYGTIAGQLLADAVTGAKSELLAVIRSLPRPFWIPRGPMMRATVNTTVQFMKWRGRKEI